MQDQRAGRGVAVDAVVPDRPGVAARAGAHPVEGEVVVWEVGAFDLRPGRAVPVQDQRVGDRVVVVVPDRPGVAARAGAHPIEVVGVGAERARAGVGAFDLRPGRAVPVQDQRGVRPGGIVIVVPDRPGVAARHRAHPAESAVEDVVGRAGVESQRCPGVASRRRRARAGRCRDPSGDKNHRGGQGCHTRSRP